MRIKICGLDMSLSCSGVSMAFCDFSECYKTFLSSLLFSKPCKGKNLSDFRSCVDFSVAMDLPEIKQKKKELASVRKTQRESENPSYDDIRREDFLVSGRMLYQSNSLDSLLRRLQPDLIFIEDYSYHSKGSLTQLAELRGSLKTLLYNVPTPLEKCKLFFAPPNSIKKVGGTKGNATKPMVHAGMERFGYELDEKRDDLTDSMAIVLTAFFAIYYRLFGLEFPDDMKKADQKSWDKALVTIGNRIGTKDEMKSWIS